MNTEFIKDLLFVFITAAVPVITTYLCKFLAGKWNEAKANVENTKIQNALDTVVDIALDAVASTNQVFVDELKKKGEFTKENAEEAFNKTKETILLMLSEDLNEAIVKTYGDVDVYLDTLIEATVKQLKQ